VAMAAKNLEPRYSVKSRFLKTAYPPGALRSLKGRDFGQHGSQTKVTQ
jgi:hypothetical protein